MCGIAGFVDFRKDTTSETLKRMTDAVTHRGPDDAGYEVYEHASALVGFGQRRLSILDLSPLGHQPMHFGENLIVNFNGEIYNFKEIRKELEEKGYTFKSWSDTEVILKGYDCWGLDVIQKFTGMFAIALYDVSKEEIYLIRDRAGVKPLYYFWDGSSLLFGSELKSLYQHPSFKKNIDVNSLALYLQFSYIPAPSTIFYDTYKLVPGHILTIKLKSKELKTDKYWDVFDHYNKPKLNVSDNEAIEQTHDLMKKAYEYRMVADVPVGVFLSGGYDSSSVAALLQAGRTDKLKTFTIGFNENEFNEAPEAKKIANYLGTDHTEWYLTAKEAGEVLPLLPEIYDEPFSDNSTVPTVLVSKLARQQVKVALSADGGDEIFGGYGKFSQAEKYTTGMPSAVQKILSTSMSLINPEYIPYFNKQYNFTTRYEKMKLIWKSQDPVQAVKYISQYIPEREVESFLGKSFDRYHTFFEEGDKVLKNDGVTNRLLAIDYKTFLVDNNLVKVDRATMSVGLEGREPMLDHKLIEYLAQLPSNFKIRNGVNKWLLKEIVHKYIPKELMERPKRPFIAPLMIWFRDELKEQLRYYLSETNLAKTGVFNPAPIIALREDYLAGKRVNYQKLWQLLVFQLWYDRWIQKL
ncbi:asparagine synthase (glutamine-hydrolyzing) [Terrimonas sp. NA20]|uniref:asparagine synthase (glutamine-hydrolyzing) n=1 Tax=Terrimonas ginsenosidimutans TaxID=2908004 RepID=A0ABS9KWY5_9BACT|nr:asparagine synthase (glutamine-hydrolyzing) [Terrimonas ginsenosidimutans]MCG2616864.1 asparagine synthase (glutamine-hydrolyzing) [Terrimonas ginsenosidimutans]